MEMRHVRFAWLLVGVLSLATGPGAAADSLVTVERAWSKATPPNATVAVVYLTLTNNGDAADRLVRAVSPVSDSAEVHAMRIENGIAGMQPLTDGVKLPPGDEVRLEPGGLHLMLIGLTAPLIEGQTFLIDLTFERSDLMTVEVRVGGIGAREPPL